MTESRTRLQTFGWNSFFEAGFAPFRDELSAARILSEHRGGYTVVTEAGECTAELTGKFRFQALGRTDFPAVGDWVAVSVAPPDLAMVHAVLPRRSKFVRKIAGERTDEQIVGANLDQILLVTSLNQDLNFRRIERYLTAAWDGGARPAIILSKSDLAPDPGPIVREVERFAAGVPVCAVSVRTGAGLDELSALLRNGETSAFVGSSGVGKSSLINWALGNSRQDVRETRASDDRGRHATTRRDLIVLPSGALVLDTPGMRELQLWADETALETSFDDVQAMALNCRFSDCQHESEPGCAVRSAVSTGELPAERLESFVKLRRELAWLERKRNVVAEIEAKRKWKKLSKQASERSEDKRR